MYDVIVVGAGAAGLTVALGAAQLGKKTLLIEKHKVGGDCTHYGCMPSKTLIKTAKVAHEQRQASKYGLPNNNPTIRWKNIQEIIHQTISGIYEHEQELLQEAGVELLKAHAQFIDERTLQAKDKTYQAKKIYLATGSKPRTITIPGEEHIEIHTNETIFSIKELPKNLAVLGAGPIGCELGQAFARLGVQVHLITNQELLPREDSDAREELRKQLLADGIRIHENTSIQNINEQHTITLTNNQTIIADALLQSIGREPNTNELGLEHTNVTLDKHGRIQTNKHLKATKGIYALGDCTSKHQFSHVSEEHGRVCLANLASPIPIKSYNEKNTPWTTYTDPEIAHIGLYEEEINERYETFKVAFSENDRAKTEHDTKGFVKIHAKPLSGKILGATIVGTNAGDLLATISLAIHNKVNVRQLSNTIQAYPTRAQLLRHTADYYYRDYVSGILRRLGL